MDSILSPEEKAVPVKPAESPRPAEDELRPPPILKDGLPTTRPGLSFQRKDHATRNQTQASYRLNTGARTGHGCPGQPTGGQH